MAADFFFLFSSIQILCYHDNTWFHLVTHFLMEIFFLNYVNETMYLLGNLFLFKIHIVSWPEMTPLVSMLSQNACGGRGPWCNSLSWGLSFMISSLPTGIKCLVKTSKGALFLSPSDDYVRCFLYLFLYFKTSLRKKLWVIKPSLWPWIKFLSSRGHEYPHRSWLMATAFLQS